MCSPLPPSAPSEADLVSGRHWAPTQPWLPGFQAPSQLPSVEFLIPWLPMAPSTLPSTRLLATWEVPHEVTFILLAHVGGSLTSLPIYSTARVKGPSEGMVRGLRGTRLAWWRGRPRKIDEASVIFGPPSGSERSASRTFWGLGGVQRYRHNIPMNVPHTSANRKQEVMLLV